MTRKTRADKINEEYDRRQAGMAAFKPDLNKFTLCPYKRKQSSRRSDWLEGWGLAEYAHQLENRKQDGTIHLFDLSGGTRIETDEQLRNAMGAPKKSGPIDQPSDYTVPAHKIFNHRYVKSQLALIKNLKRRITGARRATTIIQDDLLALLPNEVLIAIKQGLVTPAFHIPGDKLDLALSGLDEEPI